jgi:hypothetical protein
MEGVKDGDLRLITDACRGLVLSTTVPQSFRRRQHVYDDTWIFQSIESQLQHNSSDPPVLDAQPRLPTPIPAMWAWARCRMLAENCASRWIEAAGKPSIDDGTNRTSLPSNELIAVRPGGTEERQVHHKSSQSNSMDEGRGSALSNELHDINEGSVGCVAECILAPPHGTAERPCRQSDVQLPICIAEQWIDAAEAKNGSRADAKKSAESEAANHQLEELSSFEQAEFHSAVREASSWIEAAQLLRSCPLGQGEFSSVSVPESPPPTCSLSRWPVLPDLTAAVVTSHSQGTDWPRLTPAALLCDCHMVSPWQHRSTCPLGKD